MAVRIILALPHYFALYFLGIAAFVVAVIGWFAALVTGRLPDFAANYLSGYLRWYARGGAYVLLLTDEYPPFAFADAAYPVRLAVGAGRLNRLTVLFRVILAIPVAILVMLLSPGIATIVGFIAWLTALIAGRLPAALHQAFAAVLRYTIRYYGYLLLLTGSYPAGLFGDAPEAQLATVPPPGGGSGYGTAFPGPQAPYGYGTTPAPYGTPAADYGTPFADYRTPGYSTPGYGTSGYGASGYRTPGYSTPGYGTSGYGTSGYGTPWPPSHPVPEPAAPQAPSWRLDLSPGAKRLVGLFLVLGLLTAAAEGAWAGATINAARIRDREITALNTAVAQFNARVAVHNADLAREQQIANEAAGDSAVFSTAQGTLLGVLNGSSTDSTNCLTVYCFNVTSLPGAKAFAAFATTVRATPVPPGAAAIAKRLVTDSTANEKYWMDMAQADSLDDDVNFATAAEKVGADFDNDYAKLESSLGSETTTLNGQATPLNNAAATLNQEGVALNQRAAALNVTVSVDAPNGE